MKKGIHQKSSSLTSQDRALYSTNNLEKICPEMHLTLLLKLPVSSDKKGRRSFPLCWFWVSTARHNCFSVSWQRLIFRIFARHLALRSHTQKSVFNLAVYFPDSSLLHSILRRQCKILLHFSKSESLKKAEYADVRCWKSTVLRRDWEMGKKWSNPRLIMGSCPL
jgi:hypothetical protein